MARPALGEQAAGVDFMVGAVGGDSRPHIGSRAVRSADYPTRAPADQSIAFLDMARRCTACGQPHPHDALSKISAFPMRSAKIREHNYMHNYICVTLCQLGLDGDSARVTLDSLDHRTQAI